jgi:hypothetical protein
MPLVCHSSPDPVCHNAAAQRRGAVNTVRNKLTDIVVLMRWEHSQGRDLIEEFTRGQWLSLAYIVSLHFYKQPENEQG